jgi:hypothetical protein
MMVEIDPDQVRRIAVEARQFLEERWSAWRQQNGETLEPGMAPSHSMCRFSAAFLLHVLGTEIPEGDWSVVGGNPTGGDDIDPDYGLPGGYRDAGGQWQAHYWLITGDYGLVVDITADQFGGAAVICGEDDNGYRDNYYTGAVSDHLDEVRWTAGRWLAEWKNDHPLGWSKDDYLKTDISIDASEISRSPPRP